MLHWLATLASSIASICWEASARSSDRSLSPAGLGGQTNTIAGAVAVLSLPPRPAFKPESINPLFEIVRPSCANSEQVNFRYSFDGQYAGKSRVWPEVQLRAAAANVTMPTKRISGFLLKTILQQLDEPRKVDGCNPQPSCSIPRLSIDGSAALGEV
jgi:hypothetical protein